MASNFFKKLNNEVAMVEAKDYYTLNTEIEMYGIKRIVPKNIEGNADETYIKNIRPPKK